MDGATCASINDAVRLFCNRSAESTKSVAVLSRPPPSPESNNAQSAKDAPAELTVVSKSTDVPVDVLTTFTNAFSKVKV
jgi:hypothetical protein